MLLLKLSLVECVAVLDQPVFYSWSFSSKRARTPVLERELCRALMRIACVCARGQARKSVRLRESEKVCSHR